MAEYYSDKEIRKALAAQGWTPEEIEAFMATLPKREGTQPKGKE